MEGGEGYRLGPRIVEHGITEFLEMGGKGRKRTIKGQGQVTQAHQLGILGIKPVRVDEGA